MYKALVSVTLRSSILDPQGKATQHALESLGFTEVEKVRIGKLIELWVDVASPEEATMIAENAARQLLANAVMEDFSVELQALDGAPA